AARSGARPCPTRRSADLQLVRSPLAGKLPQAPQRDLDVADAQRNAVVQILVFPFFPDFYRPPLTAVFLADAEPFRVVAIGAERRSEEHTSELQSREKLVC